jgi:hypothetical protein
VRPSASVAWSEPPQPPEAAAPAGSGQREEPLPHGSLDQEVRELDRRAIMVEYLGTDFEAAEATLRKAIERCTKHPGACTSKVEAVLHRDLAVVLTTGRNRPDEGKQETLRARQLDPTIDLSALEGAAPWDKVPQGF